MAQGQIKRYNVAPKIRCEFLKAIEILARRHNRSFADIMADWLEEDPIAMFNAMAKFTLREKSLEIVNRQKTNDEKSDEELKAEMNGILHKTEKGLVPTGKLN